MKNQSIEKPIVIAAMQDMGNVGSIVINFINDSLRTKTFRIARTPHPTYVVDKGGYIDLPNESWEYKYTDDLIIFGGGKGQPQSNSEINALCQDVIDVAKKYSAKFIYTFGGFHTNRVLDNNPKTYITTTSRELNKTDGKPQCGNNSSKINNYRIQWNDSRVCKAKRNSRNRNVWRTKCARHPTV